jgi:hypothetical protein
VDLINRGAKKTQDLSVLVVEITQLCGEITHALQSNHTNPLENLVCGKIVDVMNVAKIQIKAGSLVYDDIGETVVLKPDCSDHIEMQVVTQVTLMQVGTTNVRCSLGWVGN